jgi:hypothetical protein
LVRIEPWRAVNEERYTWCSRRGRVGVAIKTMCSFWGATQPSRDSWYQTSTWASPSLIWSRREYSQGCLHFLDNLNYFFCFYPWNSWWIDQIDKQKQIGPHMIIDAYSRLCFSAWTTYYGLCFSCRLCMVSPTRYF